MNSLLRIIEVCLLLVPLMIISSCTIESAKQPSEKNLYIASDYLDVKDSCLFDDFERKTGVDVHIIPIQTEELISRLQEQGLNSGIDLIMVKSLYHLLKLNKKNVLHSINFEEQLETEVCSFSSWKFNYVALGVDPYILAFDADHSKSLKKYEDLSKFKFVSDLGKSETIPFLASVLRNKKKVKGNSWIKKFCANAVETTSIPDSLLKKELILTTYSNFVSNVPPINQLNNKSFCFPNSTGNSTLFNLRSISIVNQAQNYVNAREFIFFYTDPKRNFELNNKMQSLSVFSSEKEYSYSAVPPENLMSYYGMVERVLLKLQKR